MSRRAALLAGAFAAGSIAIAVLTVAWPPGMKPGSETAAIDVGRLLYAKHCAGCHGDRLEGQSNWRAPLPSGRMPAPPHDETGHTWHHPDDVLFRITRDGPAAVIGSGYQSDMPGFAGTLDDDEIRAILSFIRSTWPDRERQYQTEISRREKDKD
jgi:mono/diheme cytochrome c family protein